MAKVRGKTEIKQEPFRGLPEEGKGWTLLLLLVVLCPRDRGDELLERRGVERGDEPAVGAVKPYDERIRRPRHRGLGQAPVPHLGDDEDLIAEMLLCLLNLVFHFGWDQGGELCPKADRFLGLLGHRLKPGKNVRVTIRHCLWQSRLMMTRTPDQLGREVHRAVALTHDTKLEVRRVEAEHRQSRVAVFITPGEWLEAERRILLQPVRRPESRDQLVEFDLLCLDHRPHAPLDRKQAFEHLLEPGHIGLGTFSRGCARGDLLFAHLRGEAESGLHRVLCHEFSGNGG